MNLPRYDVLTSEDRLHYEFISIGPKGEILKIVEYTYLAQLNWWNLGFGDYNAQTDIVDDNVVSDNGDGRKVLATVAMTLIDFFGDYPTETVVFTGSTNLRTMVYKRAILQYRFEFSNYFIISGLNEDGNEQALETESVNFAFLIRWK